MRGAGGLAAAVVGMGAVLAMSCSTFGESEGADAGTGTGDATPTVRTFRMFVASGLIKGNFGGVTAADDRCRSSAAAAKLDGRYVALLVDAANPRPFTRLGDGRFVNTKGATLFEEKPGALSALQGAMLDESGSTAPPIVWTGTESSNCRNWTVGVGISGQSGDPAKPKGWFDNGTLGCGLMAAIYCVEIP